MSSAKSVPTFGMIFLSLFLSDISQGQELSRIQVSSDSKHFVKKGSSSPFVIWGVNYDHDGKGRLLDEYWIDDWDQVVEDFGEIRDLGANCIRIHLQVGKFLTSPNTANQEAIQRLKKLLKLADQKSLYLDITGLACYHKSNLPNWYEALEEKERWNAQAFFWETIAKTCQDHPAVFCYDLMNEPILPGNKKVETEWLTGELGGKYFVQRLALDLKNRSRLEVAESWVHLMTKAIRKHDKQSMITVGVIPWVLTWPKSKPIFYSPQVAKHLDFVSVHFYPRKNEIPQALQALKAYEIGKPLVVEETFPLKCSQQELVRFVRESAEHADGWISFYWGETAEELRRRKPATIAAAITAGWLEQFSKMSVEMRKPESRR